MTPSLAVALLSAIGTHALPELPVARSTQHRAQPAHVKRQDGMLQFPIHEQLQYAVGGLYSANITVGTPPQLQVVTVSTGSSDSYLDAPYSSACSNGDCVGGTFTYGDSDTYSVVTPAPAFNITFYDGSTASGPYATDTMCMSGLCITNVQFGVAEHIDSTTGPAPGILGIGYSANEANDAEYPNFVDVLVQSGQINSRLYSLYLSDLDSSSGSILFGGVDASKYTGSLQTFNMLPTASTTDIRDLLFAVTGLTTTVDGDETEVFAGGPSGIEAYVSENDGSHVAALSLGSGAYIAPGDVYSAILQAFSYVNSSTGLCSCTNASVDDSMTLTFGDDVDGKLDIKVPSTEVLVPYYNTSTLEPVVYEDGSDACVLMVVNGSSEGTYYLGDPILMSMYVVFDLDNGQVSLAQANADDASRPDVRTVRAGPGGVAEAVGAIEPGAAQSYAIPTAPNATASYSVSTATTTLGAVTGLPTPAATTPSGHHEKRPDFLSTGAKAGIGFGVAIAALAALGLLGWWCLRRKRDSDQHLAPRADLEDQPVHHAEIVSTGNAEKEIGSVPHMLDPSGVQGDQKHELESDWRGREVS